MLGIKVDCGSSPLRRKLAYYSIKRDFFERYFYYAFRQRSVHVTYNGQTIFSAHHPTKREAKILVKHINWSERDQDDTLVAEIDEWDK